MNDLNGDAASDFRNTIATNVQFIREIAENQDISQGLAGHATLLTIGIMNHNFCMIRINQLEQKLNELKTALCPSSSSPAA